MTTKTKSRLDKEYHVIVHFIFISNYKFNTGSYLTWYMYILANYLTHAYLCRSMDMGKGASGGGGGSKRAKHAYLCRGPNMHKHAQIFMGKGASDLKEMPVGCLHLESHPFATGWSGNVVCGIYDGVVIVVKLALVGTD